MHNRVIRSLNVYCQPAIFVRWCLYLYELHMDLFVTFDVDSYSLHFNECRHSPWAAVNNIHSYKNRNICHIYMFICQGIGKHFKCMADQ